MYKQIEKENTVFIEKKKKENTTYLPWKTPNFEMNQTSRWFSKTVKKNFKEK